jgi:hypothetical protein
LPESKGPLLKDFIDKIRKQNYCIRETSKMNVMNIKTNRRGVASLIEVDEQTQTYESLLSVPDCAENNERKDCSGLKKCVNCEYSKKTFKINVNSNHPAYSMKCPGAYLKKLEHKLKYGHGQ